MAKYCVTNGNLYESGSSYEIKVSNGSDLRVQSVGTGSYQLIGKLTANGTSKVLNLIRLSDFSTNETVNDNEIYAADVSGLYSISVQNVNGVDKVYATILSD